MNTCCKECCHASRRQGRCDRWGRPKPGEGIGNGRATTLRFAQEGARILAVDRLIASAEETAAMANQGGECVPFAADVTKEETLAAAMEAARARWGRIDSCTTMSG